MLDHLLVVSGSGGEYGGMADVTVRRVDFGYFIRPAEETGTGVPRVEPCLGYAVGHPEGMILFDTGMGSHPRFTRTTVRAGWGWPRRWRRSDTDF